VTIKVTCSCGGKFAARDELAGKQIECHTCGKRIRVPVPAAMAASGAAAPNWLVAMTALTFAAAIAAGVFGVNLNSRVNQLADTVSQQSGKIETQFLALDEHAQMLETQAQNDQSLQEKLTDLQTVMASLDQEVQAGSEELNAELDSLQENLEQATMQQAEHEEELAKLQGKATKLRGEILAAEQKIEAEMATQATGFDKRVESLRDSLTKLDADYQQTLKDTSELEKQLAQVRKDVSSLADGIAAVSANIPDTKPIWAAITKLRTQLTADTEPWFKTVFGENGVSGDFWCALRVDTRNGNTFIRKKDPTGNLTAPVFVPSPFFVAGKAGRFDVKLTCKTNGDIHDAVMLDTHTGNLWHCDVTVPGPLFTWRRIRNFFVVNYGENDAWRIDVDSSNAGAAVPRILVTDTTQKNLTYADDASPRNIVLPLF
jgi:predicted  nucleic acid-binding Zn-ribbon protein